MTENPKLHESKRRSGGGAANAGGMNFQAAATAIAYVALARGRPLGWLGNIEEDIPVAIEAETESGGDDLRLELASGASVEIQVKKGLRKGKHLWEALDALAAAVAENVAGVLLISPSSSNTIATGLAEDIRRLGDGQADRLSPLGNEFSARLAAAGLNQRLVCQKLRIETLTAQTADAADIRNAISQLGFLGGTHHAAEAAWNALYRDASQLIEHRGRRDLGSILTILKRAGIDPANGSDAEAPASLLARLVRFNWEANAQFTVLGGQRRLETDTHWLSQSAIVRNMDEAPETDLAKALADYQGWSERPGQRDVQNVDPETFCRFLPRAVLVAGPGMGKTTLLKRIARRYSADSIPVLKLRLASVAARMRTGTSFEEAVFELGLDGSALDSSRLRGSPFSNWLLLCDGLDECGNWQQQVAEGISKFAVGRPGARILITTRPVGYVPSYFSEWRHYDLLPFDSYSASHQVGRLLEALAPPGSQLADDADDIARKELDDNPIRSVISRTPLMLGMAAAILAGGARIGRSREALFEQIFERIGAVPVERTKDAPDAAPILNRFRDMLGYAVAVEPIAGTHQLDASCGRSLASETGGTVLRGTADAARYRHYWEEAGLIEQVGMGDVRTTAFTHKMLGEYAAARFIASLPPPERSELLDQYGEAPAFGEIWRFAAMLGCAAEVVAYRLERLTKGQKGADALSDLLHIAAEAQESLPSGLRVALAEKAIQFASGENRRVGLAVGNGLAALAKRFPEEVTKLCAPLKAAEQEWTRVVASNALLAVSDVSIELDTLIETLIEAARSAKPVLRPSLAGGLSIDTSDGRGLVEAFVLTAIDNILARAPSAVADSVIPEVLMSPGLESSSFTATARALMRKYRKSYPLPQTESATNNWQFGSEEYRKAEFQQHLAILDFLGAGEVEGEGCRHGEPLLVLSAFYEASYWGKVSVSEAWDWTHEFDRSAAQALFDAVVALSGLDRKALTAEARIAKKHLIWARRDGGRWHQLGLFDITQSVDPVPIDWSKAKDLPVDPMLIEAALHHPSRWIAFLAANVIEHLLDKDSLRALVVRVLNNGRDEALWAAAGMTTEFSDTEAIDLLLDRLEKPFTRGVRHLFNRLAALHPPADERLLAVLRTELLGPNDWTARAAAGLLNAVASRESPQFIPLAELAILHWKIHEEPYPEKGGAIPGTPREQLVEALIKLRDPTYEEVCEWLADRRHDISKSGQRSLLRYLDRDRNGWQRLARDVSSGKLSSPTLNTILRDEAVPLNGAAAAVLPLLKHERAAVRFNAMAILQPQFLSSADIRAHSLALAQDPELSIRERADAILETA